MNARPPTREEVTERLIESTERLIEAVEAALGAGGTVMLGPARARMSAAATAARAALGLGVGPAVSAMFAASLGPPPPEVEIDVSPGMSVLMGNIRRAHPAVVFDAHDPNRAEIEAAARRAGLVMVPSTTVQPRTIRGCDLPAGAR